MTREIPGPAGCLEARIDEPPDAPRVAVVLAHPHPGFGGTLHTKVVFHAAKALAGIGCSVLRFNFRGVGRSTGQLDGSGAEMADFDAGLDFMAARYPGLPLWAAGFSFGAWISLIRGTEDVRVSTLLAISPPIERYDFSMVAASPKPKFFIQGERDDVCPLPALRRFYSGLPEPKELVVIEAADHLFDGKILEVGDAIEALLEDFGPRKT